MRETYKRLLAIFIIFCTLISSPAIGAPIYNPDIVISMQISNPTMQINGNPSEIDPGRDTSPVIRDGRTLVPIRSIIEAFDGSVLWDSRNSGITLTYGSDEIILIIDSTTAYFNGTPTLLDVAPTIINGRTMLPIRFIAQSFNWGVAWEGETGTVSIVRNGFDNAEYETITSMIPPYNGLPYAKINENKPFFKSYEIIGSSFEYYANHDELGRCDVAMASVGKDIMPTEKRESIRSVTPTGWKNASYDIVDGGYLYNRCHLIGFQLTGENANDRNLITGTRYLNTSGMLPFENMIDEYVEKTGNNVLYRVTPIFSGDNLLADGVLLEAYSVEDSGKGICFCIYCYNLQPGIEIDYKTGENGLAEEGITASEFENENSSVTVYITPTGKKYHSNGTCGGKNSYEIILIKAIEKGLYACSKCFR